jgi:NitT/TauT family transport system ATP-binding protein
MIAEAPLRARALPQYNTPLVAATGVTKRFGRGAQGVLALAETSFTVHPGEFVCLLGPSGCGKSTLLSLIAGLDRPSGGALSVAEAQPALMFQDAALFPWLTVAGNVEFPLRMRGVGRRERRIEVERLLATVHLDGFAEKRPHELSGGMRQRVALARALAQDAHLLLMDEPFGPLDALLRERLHDELESVWQQRGLTVVFVTHDVREAARLGDRVLLLSSRPGRLIADVPIDLPRPRRGDSQAVLDAAQRIAALLRAADQHDDLD